MHGRHPRTAFPSADRFLFRIEHLCQLRLSQAAGALLFGNSGPNGDGKLVVDDRNQPASTAISQRNDPRSERGAGYADGDGMGDGNLQTHAERQGRDAEGRHREVHCRREICEGRCENILPAHKGPSTSCRAKSDFPSDVFLSERLLREPFALLPCRRVDVHGCCRRYSSSPATQRSTLRCLPFLT